MSYKASVLSAAHVVDVIERDLPAAVPEGHVRIRLATASLCGTDLHYYKHFQNAGFVLNAPVTLGHEACGYIVDGNGSGLTEGQLVALNPIINCGLCDFCRDGQENLCTAKRFPGSGSTVPHIDGFFQNFFDFPAKCAVPVPTDVDPDVLTFAEPLACAMHAVKISGAAPGKRVLVTGCGPMGLLAIVAARASGAQVDASDVRAEAVELAKTIGAEAGFVSGTDTLPSLAYDAVVEASGSPHAFNAALEAIKRQGKVSILSNIQPSATPINLHRIMLKELQVLGSFQFNAEFLQAVQLVQDSPDVFHQLIATRYSVEQTGDALAFMEAGKAAGKILIKPTAA